MLQEILNTVKQHLAENPQVTSQIPPEQQEAVHNEIATHLANNLPASGEPQGGLGGLGGGLLGKLSSAVSSGGPLISAVEGGLVSSLTSKFGLSPAATGAIAGALPGLLQKLMNKQTTS